MVMRRSEQRGRHRHVPVTALASLTLPIAAAAILTVMGLVAPGAAAQGSSIEGDVAAGRETFAANCAACHGPNAEGRGSAPSLVGVADRYPVDEVETIIRQGRGGMPAFGGRLSDAEIGDLLAFLERDADEDAAPSADDRSDGWWDGMMSDGAVSALMAVWILGGLVLLVVLVGGIVWLVRRSSLAGGSPPGPPSPTSGSAREELDRRFARGEISREEYRTMRDDLEG